MIGSLTSPAAELPQAVYTDLSSLNALRAQGGRGSEDDGQLEEAARQFSSIFLHMALKSMRDASFGGGILDSQQSEFYRDMFDQQLALDLSQNEGFGLTELIVNQLAPNTGAIAPDEDVSIRASADKAALYSQVAQTRRVVETRDREQEIPQEQANTAAISGEGKGEVVLP